MKSKRFILGSLVLFASCLFASEYSAQENGSEIKGSKAEIQRWHFFLQENAIDKYWLDVSKQNRQQTFAIINVNVISMVRNTVLKDHTVVVEKGIIKSVGPSRSIRIPVKIKRIDGSGKYLIPGLTDMHFHHLISNSHHLLNLANGVTSVREMDGFRWMLDVRRDVNNGSLLAPNMYIAGHILNGRLMEFYATPLATPDAARRAVRDQIAAGYDFIKIHNSLEPEIYQAIFDEARKRKYDVVGHIPHDTKVSVAIKGGMRTLEHFKGYINDRNLQLSDEDYVSSTKGAEIWNCPTFTTYRSHLRGSAAKAEVLESPEMKYINASDRHEWNKLGETPIDGLTKLRANIYKHSKTIFRKLLAIDGQFIAGTDSGGGIPLSIPGFALLRELEVMEENGMSPFEALKTATVNAAKAMRRSKDFGTITDGKRADLILLSKNPLETVRNLRSNDGVAVRGVWLSRRDLNQMLIGIETHYADSDLTRRPTLAEIDKFLASIKEMRSNGFIFKNFDLGEISRLLVSAGYKNRARQVRNLKRR